MASTKARLTKHAFPVHSESSLGDRKGTPKYFCDKEFAELSGELSGAICLKPLFYWVVPSNLFRKFFGTVPCDFLGLGFFLGS